MTHDDKARLWLQIFGVTPDMADKTGAKEILGLAAITASPEWADVGLVVKARPIGLRQWQDAFAFADFLDVVVSNLPIPKPGADPRGFIWLSYRTTDGRELALELHADLTKPTYRWTMTVNGERQRHETTSQNVRPVIESLRATFGDTDSARAARTTLNIDGPST